jgi:RNA 2',3'-cyclic 3'-phosphodiesterase
MDLRCFIALEIPSNIKASLADVLDRLKKSGADIKWLSDNNIHLTLKFLGNTDDTLIVLLKEALCKKISFYDRFYITITGTGCFPDKRHPRVIWAGIEESKILERLQKDIEDITTESGFTADKKKFSPHLTLGRVRSQRRSAEAIKILDEFKTHRFGDAEINSIVLMKSELTPGGARHTCLAEIPFNRRTDVK